MVSRRKILSRSRDGLNSESHNEEDIWFQKDKFFKDHIQEVLKKWKQIDDEIWAKLIVMERNRRVAKAYARAPVLTINGSDDGFDGYRIGLCGFDNPMRDAKTEELKKLIGHGIKIKMDDGGNIMVKRISRCNIYVKDIGTDGDKSNDSGFEGRLLEIEKPYKLFDMKKFAASISSEILKIYPDRKKLETQCISAIAFVKDNSEVLDCPCWVMLINIVALDMLKSKFPTMSRLTSLDQVHRRQDSQEEDPYSVPIISENPSKFDAREPKPPKLPPRDVKGVVVPMPDYDDWTHECSKRGKPRQSGYKDDPYYCGMRARVPNFGKKTNSQYQMHADAAPPVRKSHSSGYLSLLRHEGPALYKDDEYGRWQGRMRPAPSHSRGAFVGEWE